jgi:hypothetical protein
MIRVDYVFSYWIFGWFMLYYVGITRYNPFFALLVSLIENILLLILMIYYGVSIKSILSFILINFFIKVLPVIYLIKTKIILRDVIVTCILFLIYLVWLYINNKRTIFRVQKEIYNSLINEKSETPIMYMMDKLEKYVKSK